MVKLRTQFTMNGFFFKQCKRTGNIAIYEQWKDDNLLSYEVIRVKVKPAEENQLYVIRHDETEVYPKSREWGENGYTYKTIKEAEVKFNEMLTAEEVIFCLS